jgi:uncharacterized repeat protein (TIGR01451 family)
MVTLSALSTNASPGGWVSENNPSTSGNNATAFLDRDLDFSPDVLPPQGGMSRVFDFPLDLTSDPSTYASASTVQLFYRANWYHDRLYDLGFTEAAGSYQVDNFGRGGLDNDPVICLVQAGADVGNTDNSVFMPAPDGESGYCMMYTFTGPTPDRDGSLDQEIVCHELTHGLSERLVGQGVMISALQSQGLAEGWSDFYALSLLSEASDDVDGNYPAAAYAGYRLYGLQQNYYYGLRRYPYTTDMSRNPLTFKDIDPTQASTHFGVPVSPILGNGQADEVHNQGEVWCIALHEAWAAMVAKHGWSVGNEMLLQLVTDGMKLGPANPTFLEARDAILQADQLNTGGANYNELWMAFAKRGMGYGARAPTSDTTVGVIEAFDFPPDVAGTFPDGILEVSVTPINASALLAGATNSIFVRVTDGPGVTNATITATINGTNLVFRNDGLRPDALESDAVYSASFVVPTNPSSVALTLVISAPDKDTSTNWVTYSIIKPPGNDDFANAIKVPAAGAVYLSNNKRATMETDEPAHGGDVNAAASLWWNYAPLVSGNVLVDSGGSDFMSVVAVYTNNTLTNLQAAASALGTSRRKGAFVTFSAQAGVNYHLAVAAISSTDVGTLRLNIVPNGIPDTNAPNLAITSPPNGLTIITNRVFLTGTCVDPDPNPTGIREITVSVIPQTGVGSVITTRVPLGPSLEGPASTNWTAVVGLRPGDNIVRVVATDFAGNRSPAASILVSSRVIDPPNDFFALPTVLTGTEGINGGSTLTATKEVGEPNHAGNLGGKSVWWAFTPPTDGILGLSTTNSSFDTLLALYTGTTVANLTLIASNDDAYPAAPGGFSQMNQAVRANQTYHIALDGYDGAGGAFFLTWSFAPATLYHLSVGSTAGGSVMPPSGDYTNNSIVMLTATPDPSFEFVGWTGSFSAIANPLSIVINSDIILTANFRPITYSDDFETANLLKLGWTTVGNRPWVVQTNVVLAGTNAARSGAISDNQTSSLILRTNFASGVASFYVKVSSELNWDFLNFYVDGVLQRQWSGEIDWTGFSFPLTFGIHTLEWRYIKDASGSAGLDSAFIDNVNVPFHDLALTITDAPDPVFVGGTLVYTIGVTNFSPLPATGITVTDVLPVGLNYVSGSASQGTVSAVGNLVTANVGTLAPGAGAVVTIQTTPTLAGNFTNSASVTASETDLNPANNTAQTSTLVNPAADLAVAITTTPDPLYVGGTLTYTISVSNLGPSPATGVTVTDTLPAGLTYVSSSSSQGTIGAVGNLVTANVGNLAVGGGAVLTIQTRPTLASNFVNAASVAGNETDLNPANNTAQISTLVNPAADLVVTITDAPDPLYVGGTLVYTIGVTNLGPSPATGVTVTDTLPAGLSYVSSSSSQGTIGAVGNLVTANVGNLAVGGGAVLTIQTTPTVAGNFVNAASVARNETDLNPANNTAQTSTLVNPAADLGVTIATTPDPLYVGGTLVYTIGVTNLGPSPATGVTVTDTLPAGLSYVSSLSSQGTIGAVGNLVTANVGDLAVGGGAVLTIQTTPTLASNFVNAASVVRNETDLNPANNTAQTSTLVNPAADLAVTIATTPDPLYVGSTLTYTLTVANLGPSPATGVTVTNTLPAGLSYVSSSSSQGTIGVVGNLVTANVGNLAVGGGAVLTIQTTPTQAGNFVNVASVAGNETDLNAANNTAQTSTLVSPAADLAMAVVDSPDPVLLGNGLTYTLFVTNLGQIIATNVTVANTLPAGVSFVSATPSGYTLAGGVVTFTNLGNLGTGETASAIIAVQANVEGTLTNTAACGSSGPDPLLGNNSVSVNTLVEALRLGISLVRSNLTRPRLSVSAVSNNLVIAWPADATAYELESAASLTPPAVWTPVTSPPPVIADGQKTVTLSPAGGVMFFRLWAPTSSLPWDGDYLVITWPAIATGYLLDGATNLIPPVVWTPVTNPPVTVGNKLTVTVPAFNDSGFFRLRIGP